MHRPVYPSAHEFARRRRAIGISRDGTIRDPLRHPRSVAHVDEVDAALAAIHFPCRGAGGFRFGSAGEEDFEQRIHCVRHRLSRTSKHVELRRTFDDAHVEHQVIMRCPSNRGRQFAQVLHVPGGDAIETDEAYGAVDTLSMEHLRQQSDDIRSGSDVRGRKERSIQRRIVGNQNGLLADPQKHRAVGRGASAFLEPVVSIAGIAGVIIGQVIHPLKPIVTPASPAPDHGAVQAHGTHLRMHRGPAPLVLRLSKRHGAHEITLFPVLGNPGPDGSTARSLDARGRREPRKPEMSALKRRV